MQKRNKKIPGKFKDEAEGYPILEFIGLRAKSYAFKRVSKNDCIIEEKKLKGIQKGVVKKSLNFNHYKSAIYDENSYIASTCSLRSNLHQIETRRINKIATGPFDDKRYLLNDGITSVPYGDYTISPKEQ